MLRGLSARLGEGLGDEGDADYADCTDYADFEICLDCLDVVLKPRIYANARESGLEGRGKRSLRCEIGCACEIESLDFL